MAFSTAGRAAMHSIGNQRRGPGGKFAYDGGRKKKGGVADPNVRAAMQKVVGKTGPMLSEKAQRAIASHKPSTAHKQRVADNGEKLVASYTGGVRTADNLPVDSVVTTKAGKTVGIEVKTVIDNKNGKITMHPESLERKRKWAKSNKAKLHTVVVDMRGNKPVLLHSAGVGSFRLHTLTVVRDAAHLRELIGI